MTSDDVMNTACRCCPVTCDVVKLRDRGSPIVQIFRYDDVSGWSTSGVVVVLTYWFNAAVCHTRDHGFVPRSGYVSRLQRNNVSSPSTLMDSVLCGTILTRSS